MEEGKIMADFCKQCSERIFNEDYEDMKNLCKPNEMVSVLCEGCGPCYVNSQGECISENCLKKHKKVENDHVNTH